MGSAGITALIDLCRRGMLFEVQAWIAAGNPIQWPRDQDSKGQRSALQVAIETGQHSLCRVLLDAGYDLALDPVSPIDAALRVKRYDLVDLLLDYGADPRRISPEALFGTYDGKLFDRFYLLGLDFAQDHALAFHLYEHTSNKPLFGFCKRHTPADTRVQRELDLALASHCRDGNEKGALLSLWAGADPHTPTGSLQYEADSDDPEYLTQPVLFAVLNDNIAILKACKPDPDGIDLEELYCYAGSRAVVEHLAAIRSPQDMTKTVEALSAGLGLPWGDDRPGALTAVLEYGKRWEKEDPRRLGGVRKSLLRIESDWRLEKILKMLRDPAVCAPENYEELIRTPAMQRRLIRSGFIKPKPKPPTKKELAAREIARFAYRFDRERLYEEVWQKPAGEVAEVYGIWQLSQASLPGVARADTTQGILGQAEGRTANP